MFLRLWTLVVKEFLAVWRDPKTRFILVAPPLLELVVFAFAATQEVRNVPVGIINRDEGTAGRDLTARFEGSPNFSRIVYLGSEAEAARALDSGRVLLVLSIRDDFSRELAAGRSAMVQLLLDGRRSNSAQILAGYAEEIINRFNAEPERGRPTTFPPSTVVARVWFNPNLDALWSTVPALVAILTTLEGLVITAGAVARERELGTFEQVLVSPLSPWEIVVGKTVPAFVIGMAVGLGMAVVGTQVLGVPFHGSVLLLVASMLLYLLAIVGVGLFISSLVRAQQQAFLGVFTFMVPSITLSGFASPVENMPDWLQTLTLANPVRHFIVIVKGVFLKDAPAAVLLQSLWPLAVIAVATLSAATWLFRRRLE